MEKNEMLNYFCAVTIRAPVVCLAKKQALKNAPLGKEKKRTIFRVVLWSMSLAQNRMRNAFCLLNLDICVLSNKIYIFI